jgi:ribosomal protein S12 methylthiotransferase accessory factor
MMERLYYALANGTDVVSVGPEKVTFRSDTGSLALEGESAVVFAERILPLLDGRRALEEVAATLPSLPVEQLRAHLDALVDAHVLVRSASPRAGSTPPPNDAFLALLESIGLPREKAADRLQALHVVALGLEGAGAHAVVALAGAGVGRITLVDPFPCSAGDLAALPHTSASAVGRPRQDIVRELLADRASKSRVESGPAHEIDKDSVLEMTRGASLVLATFDRAFAAANQWVNRASIETGVPALFGQMQGHRWIAGPLVIPDETACYLCWRMRSIACSEDFASAMAYEEYLDQQRHPQGGSRPVIPSLHAHLGSVLATEALKMFLALGTLTLAGRIQEYDALAGTLLSHHVLFRPECPACAKKKPLTDAATNLSAAVQRGDILAAQPFLVSPRCGIVRTVRTVLKDPSEPEIPYVSRAELANHRFLSETGDEFIVGSGKGFTPEEARASALGEAIERYSASLTATDDIRSATCDELPGRWLDPRRLVLYRPEQYAHLAYSPYKNGTQMGWLPCRSFLTTESVHVPAIAVFMAYDVRHEGEFIAPITSNGLAAGPTLADALRSAALEVIERDAFLHMWLHRLRATRVDAATHPDARVMGVVRAYDRRGVRMELFRLTIDHAIPVFAALGVEDRGASDGPAVVVGLGADLVPAVAARRAILEVAQVRPALRVRLRSEEAKQRVAELLEDPHRVTSLDDHDLLYTSRTMIGAFDFLRNAECVPMEWSATIPDAERMEVRDAKTGALDDLRTIARQLDAMGTELLYRDLTTADVRPFGLHTVRALIPDFQPIHFGRAERRLGGTRLYEVPRRLGLRSTNATIDDLNDLPHPLA